MADTQVSTFIPPKLKGMILAPSVHSGGSPFSLSLLPFCPDIFVFSNSERSPMQSQICKQAPVLHWKHWQGTALPKLREEKRSYLSRDSVTVLSNTIWENLVKDLLLHRYPFTLFEYIPSFWCRATEDEHLQVNGRCSRQLEHYAGRVIPIRKRKAVKKKKEKACGTWRH